MISHMISYVKSCILGRVCKLSRVVVYRFDYDYWKFGDKHCVICLKIRIVMTLYVTKVCTHPSFSVQTRA